MNKLNFLIILASLILSSIINLKAQVDFHYSQYAFNPYVINPAYAGTGEALEISSSFRKQWFGVQGSPFSNVLTAHAPLSNKSIGLGLIIANDKIGVHNNFNVSTSYSYKIKLRNKNMLSMGLQGGIYQHTSNYSEILESLQNNNDPVFNELAPNNTRATFGTGLFYYSKRFYTGISLLNLETNKVFDNVHAFFTAGGVFEISDNFIWQPGVLIRNNNNSTFSTEVLSNFVLNKVLWLGASYRTFSSLNLLSQIQVTPQIRVGYSYDISTNGVNTAGAGTHEIMLKYRFTFYRARVVTPRYF